MQDKKPTIEDVARLAGISRSAVSRAINNVPGVSGDVRSRVRQVVDTLGYQPNPMARMLATGRTNEIELVVIAWTADTAHFGVNPYFSRVLAGMLSELAGTDTHLRLRAFTADEAFRAVDQIAQATSHGAVLVNVPPELATQFHQRGARVVSLGATAECVPAVEAQNTRGAYAAVSHLYDLGRRRIAAIHGPATNTCGAARRVGHLDAIRDFGLPDIWADGQFCREGGYQATEQLLRSRPDIDAVFAATDEMAAGAIQALAAAGRRVPDDVSVVGFDDSIIAASSNPPMTTIRLPVEEMAAAATRTLLDGRATPYWRKIFPVDLLVRESASRAANRADRSKVAVL